MLKYNILKIKENHRGDVNVALRANVGLKISSTKTIANANDDTIVKIQKSLSVRKDKLAEILNSKTFQPLFIDTNGTSPSTTVGTSSNICDENVQPQSNNEGITHRISNGMENLTPPSIASHISAMNVNPKTPQNHHMLTRLQRDLDSPSAATRLRAIRALKSPANGPYNLFDVPHEEQDIITEEERQEYVPQTIQDVMRDIIVYVEVRFGDENRTASIKEAMAELGATVNDNFNKNTTHVIFSNGTQSTYNKAKQLNIPIVSILWIEACKKQLRLVDPIKYSIHNIEQYENPELYKKVKVKKFFQTENELKIKKKKTTPTLIKFKPIKIPKKAKDNITGMMDEFQKRQVKNSNGIDHFAGNFNVVDLFNDSKAGMPKEVNAKRSLAFDAESTVTSSPMHLNGTKTTEDNETSTSSNVDSNVSLEKPSQMKSRESATVFKTPLNRKTMLAQSALVEPSPKSLVRVTRRTSMLALSTPAIQRNRQVMPEEITEITDSNDNQTNNNSEAMDITPNVVSPPRVISNRRTIFTSSAMDITHLQPSLPSTRKRNSIVPARFKDFEVNTKKYHGKNASSENASSEKSNRRRTVFAPSDTAPSSSTVSTLNKADSAIKSYANRRRTLNTPKTSATTQIDASPLNEIHEGKESDQTVFAPNEASSPLVVNGSDGQKIASTSTTLATTPMAKVGETTTPNSKRRRTLLPPTVSDSLVVSTLKKVTEANGESRRRTVFTPSHGSLNPSGTPLSRTPPDEIQNRRRTCFATSQTTSNQSTPVSDDKLTNGLNSVANGAEHTKDASRDCLTPQGHTLFEEYSKRLSFSSTNKRHTDRDISLFIIEQRLKNLNEIARLNRSHSESDVNIGDIEKRIKERIARSSPQLQVSDYANVNQDALPPPPPKRRKLFNPNAYDEQAAMQNTDSSDNNNKANVEPAKKLLTKKTKIPSLTPHEKRLKQRRSTMDFKTEPPKPVKVYASIMKSNTPMNYLAYSNMNLDQVNVINKV